MLKPEQESWVAHLRDDDQIVIKPFDPSAGRKFEIVRNKILTALGQDIIVLHRGATSLGISGQDEIDVYIPVPPTTFNRLIGPLTKLFGTPRSHYELERARFVTHVDGKIVDVFLINKLSQGWLDGVVFEDYLRQHPEDLEAYRKLKEEGNGLSTREYYRRKIEFINEVLRKAGKQ
ncbi:MAG: GrpB family protein [bacterium]|nr:GrpB family protein [bacterium]